MEKLLFVLGFHRPLQFCIFHKGGQRFVGRFAPQKSWIITTGTGGGWVNCLHASDEEKSMAGLERAFLAQRSLPQPCLAMEKDVLHRVTQKQNMFIAQNTAQLISSHQPWGRSSVLRREKLELELEENSSFVIFFTTL